MKQIWKTVVPKLEVLSPSWTGFLRQTLTDLYHACPEETSYRKLLLAFQKTFPEWQVQKEQLMVYWLYTYFCGAVYDERIFAKGKMGGALHSFYRGTGTWAVCGKTRDAGIQRSGLCQLPVLPGIWNIRIRI